MRSRSIVSLAAVLLAAALVLLTAVEAREFSDVPAKEDLSGLEQVLVLDGSNVHNVGELWTHVGNWGVFGSMPSTAGQAFTLAPSAEWPGDSGVEHLFISGLWIGAKKEGIPSVSTAAFELEFRPTEDPIDIIYRSFEGAAGGIRYPADADDDGDGMIDEDWLDGHDNDADGFIDEDFAAISDQMFSCWFTDDQSATLLIYPEHTPLGLMVRQESYQWEADRFDDAVGIRYVVENTGEETLEGIYLGFFADCDIGSRDQAEYWADDAVDYWSGLVDTEYGMVPVRMAYSYDTDGDGGATPSYFGVVLLGHTVDSSGVTAPSSSGISGMQIFTGSSQPFENGGDPTNDFERYEAMSLTTIDRHVENGDFRMLMSSGPFASLAPGETLEIHYALVAGYGLEGLLENAAYAQRFFDGTRFDIDGDPMTGPDGKETLVHWYLDSEEPVAFNILDIRPGSCPNPFNVKLFDWVGGDNEHKGGVLPVAILGSDEFDVYGVDVSTVRLEGVRPCTTGIGYDDVSRPIVDGYVCECTSEGPDGYLDLTMKFNSLEIAAAILAGDPPMLGDRMMLTMTGELTDGTPFTATDCIVFVGKKKEQGGAPKLLAASPNPFNPVTRVSYYLPERMNMRLAVYDVSGRLVDVLAEGVRDAGEHAIDWSAGGVASGIYFYSLEAGGMRLTKKMVLLR
jgi:hypothetical protein